ncbi:MAG: Unknown protein [uncultured Thiotrichaceae bacterium]|uniref:TIGR02450 family Trp-rich protein n=1 Tax=uncultured Thiotrichaceae bacterium TaxID=298394 RepID=A0A6S6TG14_9GAMM|nr:MAG: Unknown protein [uncultured Thiotrichaceae bacterium]
MRKQKHFIVTKLVRDDTDQIRACELEAVINREATTIDWQELKDESHWTMGWK